MNKYELAVVVSAKLEDEERADAVSYTHLDVYKRQAQIPVCICRDRSEGFLLPVSQPMHSQTEKRKRTRMSVSIYLEAGYCQEIQKYLRQEPKLSAWNLSLIHIYYRASPGLSLPGLYHVCEEWSLHAAEAVQTARDYRCAV